MIDPAVWLDDIPGEAYRVVHLEGLRDAMQGWLDGVPVRPEELGSVLVYAQLTGRSMALLIECLDEEIARCTRA